jgi:hypothetical protein
MQLMCPNCQSENIQSFQMVYEGGTSSNISQTSGLGVGMSGGRLGVGVGGATTRSTSMTLIAQKVAPPMKKNVPLWLWLVAVFFIPLLLLPIFLQTKYSRWNKQVWPQLYVAWENSWLCHKCGHSFSL